MYLPNKEMAIHNAESEMRDYMILFVSSMTLFLVSLLSAEIYNTYLELEEFVGSSGSDGKLCEIISIIGLLLSVLGMIYSAQSYFNLRDKLENLKRKSAKDWEYELLKDELYKKYLLQDIEEKEYVYRKYNLDIAYGKIKLKKKKLKKS